LQADGKIVVGGDNGLLTRLTPQGVSDPTFFAGARVEGAPSNSVTTLAVQTDGKILVSGAFTRINGVDRLNVARLNADGSVDAVFTAAPAIAAAGVVRFLPLGDGRVIVIPRGANALARLARDGAIDPTFVQSLLVTTENNTLQNVILQAAAFAADGKIVVAGATFDDGMSTLFPRAGYIARLNADGTPDPTLPLVARGLARTELLTVLSDGKILWGTTYPSSGWRIDRLKPDGTNDLTFVRITGGLGRFPQAGYMRAALDAKGRIVVMSTWATANVRTERFSADGTKDATIEKESGLGTADTLVPLPDGRMLVAGSYLSDGVRRFLESNAPPRNRPVFIGDADPRPIVVEPGTDLLLSAAVGGSEPITAFWTGPLPLEPDPATHGLRLRDIRTGGVYYPIATNAAGTTIGPAVLVSVFPRAPAFVQHPMSLTVNPGEQAAFSVEVSGSGPVTYQWFFNDQPLVNDARWLYLGEATAARAGVYRVVVRTPLGVIASATATLTVGPSSHLANVATRGFVSRENNVLISGFVLRGPMNPRVRIRAVGPGLAAFGVNGTLVDPKLELYDSAGRKLAENDDWDADVLGDSAVPMFALSRGSKDAVLDQILTPGNYTVHLSGKGAEGVALIEVYQLSDTSTRLINISSRVFVGTGAQVAIPGIVVQGTAPKRMLIRAVGPGLAQFGVTGTLADPRLEIVDQATGAALAQSDDWDSALASAQAGVGAFPLTAGSKDAALVVTLAPGNYTAVVTGANNGSGIAIVEAYELP
jgi:uncharacterized delta-60 repeat protein